MARQDLRGWGWTRARRSRTKVDLTAGAQGKRKLRFHTPKKDKSRTVELDVATIASMRELRERRTGEQVTDVGQLVFQRLPKDANVPRIPFHFLRHCCARWLLGAGLDLLAVIERLGHWSRSHTLTVFAHAIRGRQANSRGRSAPRSSRGAFLT